MTQTTPLSSKIGEFAGVLRAHLPELRERYGVASLGLFGSFVRGEQHEHSDLDVLVEFDGRPLSLLDVVHLELLLTDLLGVKVDLVEKQDLRPQLQSAILEEVIEL